MLPYRLRVSEMHRISHIALLLALFLAIFVVVPTESYAQESPDTGDVQAEKRKTAHPALRGFAETGMGILFGTVAGGAAFITSLYVNKTDVRPAFISGAILYPIGIASGAILGGYLTDTQSSYWEPFVGAFVGAGIADLTAYFLADDWPIFSALLVLVLPVVTTVLAMEVSHARRSRDVRFPEVMNAQAPTERVVMPFSLSFGF